MDKQILEKQKTLNEIAVRTADLRHQNVSTKQETEKIEADFRSSKEAYDRFVSELQELDVRVAEQRTLKMEYDVLITTLDNESITKRDSNRDLDTDLARKKDTLAQLELEHSRRLVELDNREKVVEQQEKTLNMNQATLDAYREEIEIKDAMVTRKERLVAMLSKTDKDK